MLRFLASLLLSMVVVGGAVDAFGAAITPQPLKTIATVVAHRSGAHGSWVAAGPMRQGL